MIYREKDKDYPSALCYDLILDDIVLSDLDDSTEQLQHLLNIDCALALSVCKSRNLPPCVFVLSLLYMKRLRALNSSSPLVKVENLTTKELYLIAALIADKYLIDDGEDEQLYNSDLVELTGIALERINLIERQVLLSLNWNLHISDDEYEQFLMLFKKQIGKRLNKTSDKIDTDEAEKFYSYCFKLLPQFAEYLALTSLVLLGSTLSILTAIHMGTLTHTTLMRTLNPPKTSLHLPVTHSNEHSYQNRSVIHERSPFNNKKYLSSALVDTINKTTKDHHHHQSAKLIFEISSCSIDLLRPFSSSRPLIETFG